ncbi:MULTISPECIES: heme exporter protein CcmD [unclassified Roseitalea]|uniref:heme exporter protein CcmD n=1 Tax=unclassified Roseitalea TaxID=2639107 RepID=UPI00273FD43A|nr:MULTISPECIES: heme exporter protein CcmD [unclassified Roseitalea]
MWSHGAFVLASYGAAFGVLALVIVWLLIDRAATMREIERLERAGLTRRSARGGETDGAEP